MNFVQEIKKNTLILRISGDMIEEDNGSPLLHAVNDAAGRKAHTCIIDISNLRYINSMGVGVFIIILTKFRNKGGEVYLMKPSESVKKVLAITKLNAIFQIIDSEDAVPSAK